MNILLMRNIRLLLVLTGLLSVPAMAEESAPLELRGIMQGLGKNMQNMADGIAREDWAWVAKQASQVADHPRPPMTEKLRILGFLGGDMLQFKSYDEKTHDAAAELALAAADNNGYRVISQFFILQQTCLNCHQRFRASIRAHFYSSEAASE